jgi:phage-related protein
VDLSAAGFGSVDSAAKMLGKALNDPVKGMTALGRAGVTFTKGQQKQIKALVKSGDLLGAQKIILGEVRSQVGGAAAASATAGEKMRVAWDNAKEGLGTALLPAIDALQNAITTKIIPAIVSFIGFLQKNPAIIKAFAIGIAAIAAAFVVAFVAANAIVVGIGLVVAALVYAYTQSETFRKVVNAVFKFVSAYVKTHVKIVVAVIKAGIRAAIAIWNGIKAIVGFVRNAFTAAKNFISNAINAVKTTVSNGVKRVVTFFKELPGKVISAVKSLVTKLKNFGKDAMNGLWNGLVAGAKRVFAKAREIANKVASTIKGALKVFSPSKVMIEVGKNVTKGLELGIASGERGIEKTMLGLGGTVAGTQPGIGARFTSANLAPAGASSGPMVAELFDPTLRVEKDGMVRLVDGRIRLNNRQGAMTARYT